MKEQKKREVQNEEDVELLLRENSRKEEEIQRLKEELKEQTEQKRRYKEEMFNHSIVDRWEVGKYLHDNLAQKLTFAKILINMLKERVAGDDDDLASDFDELLNILDEGARDVRDLSHDIIPVDIAKGGVSEAFKYLEEQARNRHGVNCSLEDKQCLQKISNREIATNLYHITQEAIKNAIVHGQAQNIHIQIVVEDGNLHLRVKDDGKGYDPSKMSEGMGITIMKHRAEEMGGSFSITGTEGNEEFSTCITCQVPADKCIDSS